jgi:outer membrane biosynthesis protein TonB
MKLNAQVPMSQQLNNDPPALFPLVTLGSVIIHCLALWMINLIISGKQTAEISTKLVPIQLIELQATDIPAKGFPSIKKTSTGKLPEKLATPSPLTTAETRPISPSLPAANNQPDSSPPQAPIVKPRLIAPPVISKLDFKPTPKKFPSVERENKLRRRSPSQTSPSPLPSAVKTPSSHPSSLRQVNPNQDSPRVASGGSQPALAPKNSAQTANSNQDRRDPGQDASGSPTPTQGNISQSKDLTARSQPTNNQQTSPLQSSQEQQASSAAESSQPQQSGGIVATLSNIRDANRGKDIPEKLAKPYQQEKQFDYIPLPSSKETTKQVVVLQVVVLIDDTGKPEVQSTQVLQGSKTIDSQQLAQDIIKDWKFEPAYQGNQPVSSVLQVVLTLEPQSP